MKRFSFTEETITQVLNYLAARPFGEVHQLIAKIQGEAREVAEEVKQD